ncbi:MAG: EamA family transporter [Acidobacteria bacterium]|nr:EamA family transporter [Acidobacteriota bacterium]MCL5287143.1 EamA family transporter [Acidobacteriota bacterium]
MTAHKRLRTKTVVLLALMIVAGATGDVLLSKGVKQIGELQHWTPRALAEFLSSVFTNATVWLGIACLIAYFVCYMLVLSWADFSFVLPASALTYVLVPVLARVFLNEMVTPLRWAGVGCIFLGVMLVGLTPPSTTRASADHPAEQD